ncbi:MAG: hypothetical protein MOB07_19745 [Acidobacteria bacterium]|nr:hypothetical protein [Acidobacteriota bacterium]
MLKREELQLLVGKRNDHCASIYLPTHRAGVETRQDPIKLKNLLGDAENRLLALGLKDREARELLKPAQQLLHQENFWQHQSDGLAMFLTKDFFRHYSVPLRFPNLAVVTDRFHLKPLMLYFTSDDRYYLLALSQNQVRIFEGSRYSLNEIFPRGMPVSLADALDEEEAQKQMQFHTSAPSGTKRAAVFHGHGGNNEVHQDQLLRYFDKINASLHDLLKEEHAPLVLAGVEYLHPIYHSADTYPHILLEGIRSNPERMPLEELQKEAWTIVHPYYQRVRKEAERLYWELTGTGQTTNRVSEAISAAVHGRIATLFLPEGVQSWGSFNEEQNAVTMHADAQQCDEDLLELTALRTLATGGTVFAVEPQQMPDSGSVAAIFRY